MAQKLVRSMEQADPELQAWHVSWTCQGTTTPGPIKAKASREFLPAIQGRLGLAGLWDVDAQSLYRLCRRLQTPYERNESKIDIKQPQCKNYQLNLTELTPSPDAATTKSTTYNIAFSFFVKTCCWPFGRCSFGNLKRSFRSRASLL